MRTSYQTQQKTALLSFLEQNAERQFTIDEILSAMGEIAPAKSTAYRLIKKLCDDGQVRRFTREGTASSVYQLAGSSCCSEHLHIKCVDCGLLIHLDRAACDTLAKATGFVIDDEKSMLYGHCANCARRSK